MRGLQVDAVRWGSVSEGLTGRRGKVGEWRCVFLLVRSSLALGGLVSGAG